MFPSDIHPRAQAVLKYWFEGDDAGPSLWFGGTPEIDEDIRTKFSADIRAAIVGDYDTWTRSAYGTLALLVLLDQFCLNIYRDQPRSFTCSAIALPIALEGLRKGQDQEIPILWRLFFYLPLEHAEDIHLQNRCMRLFKRMVADASPGERPMCESFLDYAERHHRVIARFGRYPDRNPILGREPTSEEQKYMNEGGPDF